MLDLLNKTNQMDPTLKQTLVSYIEAYAAAKASGNEVLVRLSAAPLQEFLTTYEIVDPRLETGAEGTDSAKVQPLCDI